MDRKTIHFLFKIHNGENFTISTDCAVGRGINGVDYTTYCGQCVCYPTSDPETIEKCEIVAIGDGYLELHYTLSKYTSGKGTWVAADSNVVIPFEHITSISFLNEKVDTPFTKRSKNIPTNKLFD